MRKVLIAAVVAVVLFAVGAFAASFLVDAEDIASGTDDVVACALRVDVNFDDATRSGGDYVTDGAQLTFVDNPANPTPCDGQTAQITVQTTVGTVVNENAATSTNGTIGATGAHVDFTAQKVAEITGVDVLVEGHIIPTT